MDNSACIVTGSQGFLGGYICRELLAHGYNVVGIDNYSKYGRVARDYDNHPNFQLIEYDLTKGFPYNQIGFSKIDYIIAGAARIGGISYFSKYPRYIMRDNELILANTFDFALERHYANQLKRLVVISSSMVFEGADIHNENSLNSIHYGAFLFGGQIDQLDEEDTQTWPSKEGYERRYYPPPTSVYGFQKLAAEYWAYAYNQQDGLPYTIVRPYNCVGLGEETAISDDEVLSGNIKLQLSHVLPDLVNKVLRGQDPLHILGDGSQIRCYTHGKDIARGIVLSMESDGGLNNDFNISTERTTTVLKLAQLVWHEIYGNSKPFRYVSDEPYECDVQKRVPSVKKARELLGFEAKISLEESVKEVVDHMRAQL